MVQVVPVEVVVTIQQVTLTMPVMVEPEEPVVVELVPV